MPYPVKFLKAAAELAFKYVDEDDNEPDSSPAVSVRSPEDPGTPILLTGREKNVETFVNYILAGYGEHKVSIDGRFGSVGFEGNGIVMDFM
ncbi:hypothetical protein [Geoglobus acetivorans]|uniref:Uncharacterized protein n=1 Tax=Geoglobus acetivorans TaxID=565033 RepID=A0A0A7GE72_GEOAI|nr:hypothetical protein GACE_0204 [Geoglobus acetivorans]